MKPILFAVLAGLCWGVGEFLTKSVLRTGKIGPFSVLLVRAVMELPPALIAYFIAVSWLRTEPSGWWKLEAPLQARLILGPGVLAGFAGVLFFYLGLKFGPITTVKPIAFSIGPAVGALLACTLLGEQMTVVKAFGIVLVLAGVVLVAGDWTPAAVVR
jgi:bacterial/archaeal transporter family protein